jgi:hypothetical protein
MSIDMKDYAGEIDPPAAVEQQSVVNQYEAQSLKEELGLPEVPKQESPVQTESLQESKPEPTAQELNFKALSDSVEKLKAEKEAEKREYQLQLDMLRANLSKQQEAPSQAKRMFEGMEDTDVPNVGELRKAWQERETAYNEKIEELQVANMHPDYAEVLGKYGKHLAETDPVFLQGLKGAENKALFAYQYAKKEQRIQQLEEAMKTNSKPTQTQERSNAQKIVENARKPGNMAQAGGQSVLSKADYFATMSDADFMKYASKHIEGI